MTRWLQISLFWGDLTWNDPVAIAAVSLQQCKHDTRDTCSKEKHKCNSWHYSMYSNNKKRQHTHEDCLIVLDFYRNPFHRKNRGQSMHLPGSGGFLTGPWVCIMLYAIDIAWDRVFYTGTGGLPCIYCSCSISRRPLLLHACNCL